MENMITFKSDKRQVTEYFSISNSLTTVFVSILALSGSILAKTIREKELIIWLSEHDYRVSGLGTYGFEVTDIPWTISGFEAEKDFLLKVIENSYLKSGWNLLSYEPYEKGVFHALDEFKKLINLLDISDVNEEKYIEWKGMADINPLLKTPVGFPKCPKHQIYLHFGGCVICKDM